MSFKDQLIEYLSYSMPNDVFPSIKIDPLNINLSEREVKDYDFSKLELKNKSIEHVKFIECNFIDIEFNHTLFFGCTFIKCSFEGCNIINTDILVCSLTDTTFDMCIISSFLFFETRIYNSVIKNCHGVYSLKIEVGDIENLTFLNVELNICTISNQLNNNLLFDECRITGTHFNNDSFKNIKFVQCEFNKSMFTNSSNIDSSTFKKCYNLNNNFNTIDFQTILQSSHLDGEALKLFGIANTDVKDYVESMTKPVKYQSVFVSYSFKDSNFARYLNEAIRHRGINTFLWEHDAPGGRRLKRIMQESIRKHDRVLFIASCNSLKSQACHFELSEARTIQDKEWKDIYYPIHIDDYLFQVQKDDIRPKECREEYWKNIEEILDFNSLPFIEYKDNYHNNPAFEEQVDKLVNNLKI